MEPNAGLDVEVVWSLATGGSNVAADPNLKAPPEAMGPPTAGVAEACQWFTEGLQAGGPRRFLFFVGGPGGGKSQAASSLVAGLEELDPQDSALAHRIYRYATPHGPITLINDATIATDDDGILGDIREAFERGDHLIVCINRGILADARTIEGDSMAHNVADWLTSPDEAATIRTIKDQDYLRVGALVQESGETIALLAAVLIDTCSLFEVKPTVALTGGDLAPGKYKIGAFGKVDRTGTPAGTLVAKVVKTINWPTVVPQEWDPVRANIDSLQQGGVLAGHLQLMRAAEICLGERFTYRELWGAISRLLFGDLPLRMGSVAATTFIAQRVPREDATPEETFSTLKQLALLRSFIGLFGGFDTGSPGVAQDPVLRFLRGIDPILDTRPGSIDSSDGGWASPVLDAFGSTALGGSPLDNLELEMPEDRSGIIQSFDRSLDEAYRSYCAVAKPEQRSSATAWYGAYLSRMYAAAVGVPAFREVVSAWTQAWGRNAGLPDALSDPIRTLLSPRRNPSAPNSNPVVPVYASRTEPILGYVSDPTLALRASTFQFGTRRDGEALHLTVKEDGATVGSVLLDFDLLREAMTCSDDWLGMTEAREKTEPRVERFRSRRLVSERMAASPQLAVEHGMRDDQISVETD